MAEGKRGGVNWGALMKIAAPVIGDLASGRDSDGSFMSGFMRAQQRAEDRRREVEEEARKRKATGANFLLEGGQKAMGYDNPIDFENYRSLLRNAYVSAGFGEPGDVDSLQFNQSEYDRTKAEAQLKELTRQIEAAKKNGFTIDDLIASGASFKLEDGKTIPVASAVELTASRPIDSTGAAIPAPKPVVKPPDRSVVESQFDDFVEVWKLSHPGEKPPPAVRTQLRAQAQKSIGQADDRPAVGRDPALVDLDKTLKGLQAKREQAELEKLTTGDPTQKAEALDTAREVERIASALAAHPGLPGAFGVMQSRLPTFRQNTANAETLLNSLTSLLTLENMSKMKGVLSDADMRVLRQASTTLSSSMSDDAAKLELERLITVMQKVINAGGTTPRPADAGGLVPMVAPDGRALMVPANKVREMEAKGAKKR